MGAPVLHCGCTTSVGCGKRPGKAEGTHGAGDCPTLQGATDGALARPRTGCGRSCGCWRRRRRGVSEALSKRLPDFPRSLYWRGCGTGCGRPWRRWTAPDCDGTPDLSNAASPCAAGERSLPCPPSRKPFGKGTFRRFAGPPAEYKSRCNGPGGVATARAHRRTSGGFALSGVS